MFPPDPYGQFDEQPSPDANERPHTQPTTVPRHAAQPPYYESRAGGDPLPLPYDDYDPTYQETPPHQPPVYQEQQTPTYPEAEPAPRSHRWIFRGKQRGSRGQAYAPPPNYQTPPVYQSQPPPQQQIIYVRERRPSLFSISCSILSILLLMACGLLGLAVFRGVTGALQSAGKTIPANLAVASFCVDESTRNYSGAYQLLSSSLQQLINESDFANDNNGFDQQDGFISGCARSTNSSDTVNGDSVTIVVTVTRSNGSSVSGNFIVEKQGSSWVISHIDEVLNLV